jgi:hypothetical protein
MSRNIMFVLMYHRQKPLDLSHIFIFFILVVKQYKQNGSTKKVYVTVKTASY